MTTPKSDYWRNVSLPPSGVAPGTYSPVTLTIDEFGRVINAITSSSLSLLDSVPTINDLSTITPAPNGEIAVVLDNGFGHQELYIWNTANSDLGPPLFRWRLLSTTDIELFRVNYRQSNVGIVTQNIAHPLPDDAIVKEISVEVIEEYSMGATIQIEDSGSFVYMPDLLINPQLESTYETILHENITPSLMLGGTQLIAVIGGAPAVGSCRIYVKYILG
jgi:hypothetical protein